MEKSQNANNYDAQKQRALKRKWEIIQERGGKCEICGYDKNLAAIEFHHNNSEEKDFGVDLRKFANTKLETLKLELEKCSMLCANCHREFYNPTLMFENIPNLLEEVHVLSFKNPSGNVCPICGKRFPKVTGKIYCSSECNFKSKNYPSLEELEEQYKLLNSWEKVAQYFNITRKITQGIRKRES